MISSLFTFLSSVVSSDHRSLDAAEVVDRRRMVALLGDKSLETATAMLTELYNEVYPSEEAPSIPHKSWRLLGFQQDNPVSDLRASGASGLAYMIWHLKSDRYKYEARRILIEQQKRLDQTLPDADKFYPYYLVSTTLLSYILSNYKIVDKYNRISDESLWTTSSETFTFEKVYTETSLLLGIFHQTWKERNASYMDFPVIFEEAKKIYSSSK